MVDKIANPAAAANAYANTAKVINASEKATEGASFADLMKSGVVGTINALRGSEQMSAKAITGEANLPDVVRAVNAADLSLQTIVAVRDRLINAYTEIMRMPI